MRSLVFLLAIVLPAWVLGLWLPFWSLSVVALLAGFALHPGSARAFLLGALAGGLLWGLLAWRIDAANAQVLSSRIGQLFGTGATAMVALTALVGALLAGLSALLGDTLRTPPRKRRRR